MRCIVVRGTAQRHRLVAASEMIEAIDIEVVRRLLEER
jgi:hypothetical protein